MIGTRNQRPVGGRPWTSPVFVPTSSNSAMTASSASSMTVRRRRTRSAVMVELLARLPEPYGTRPDPAVESPER